MFDNRKLIASLACAVLAAVTAGSALAESTWAKNHPRRHEVNSRLNNQNQRIHNEVQSGQITKQQAAGLHHEDHQIRQEERAMASQNGSHLTRQEQRTLNQQENQVSKQIGK